MSGGLQTISGMFGNDGFFGVGSVDMVRKNVEFWTYWRRKNGGGETAIDQDVCQ